MTMFLATLPILVGATGKLPSLGSADAGLSATPPPIVGQNAPSSSALGLRTAKTFDDIDASSPRFEPQRPLPTLPSVILDMELNGRGLALQMARSRGLQARVLWIDCTANIERYNTVDKIAELIAKIEEAGFNTIVFDVKPISGHVVYPSKLAPKLEEWRGRTLPKDFDPLRVMLREAKAAGLWFFVSLNAFSEGHRDFKIGPGYDWPDRQTVLYETQPNLRFADGMFPISPIANRMPEVDSLLGAFNDPSKLPPPGEGRFAISIARDWSVVDGFEFGGDPPRVPTIPNDGCVIVGFGRGAEFLRSRAWAGRKAQFDAVPLFVPISARPEQQVPLMMNPNHPQVRERAFAIVRELATNYAIDGILYDDRLRYAGMNADFSEITRKLFEKHLGKPINWPDDVFRFTYTPRFDRGISPGPYFQEWLTFRAATLQDYVAQARKTLQAVRPSALFGVYAGSWYGEYSTYGANYGAPELDAGFWYLTSKYRQTGFAPLLDLLITGCYYPTATIHEALSKGVPIGYSIEYAGYLSNQVARDQTWTYAGIMLSQFRGDPAGLQNALQAAVGSTQGVMVFDLSHDIEPFWPVFKIAFANRATPPHARPTILAEIRRRRLTVDREMWKRDPVVIVAGQMGAGH